MRAQYLLGSGDVTGPAGERLARWGLAGLFDPDPPRGYVAQVHAARVRGWGGVDRREAAVREVVRLLLGAGTAGVV